MHLWCLWPTDQFHEIQIVLVVCEFAAPAAPVPAEKREVLHREWKTEVGGDHRVDGRHFHCLNPAKVFAPSIFGPGVEPRRMGCRSTKLDGRVCMLSGNSCNWAEDLFAGNCRDSFGTFDENVGP